MRPGRTVDLQIRGVPRGLRDAVRRRAAGKGVSMSRYVIEVLRDDMERPTMAEWLEEVRRLPKVKGIDAAELIREARREEGWEG
ncbi:MAG TPA: hypothetical protein VFM93_00370 [Candidatus Limnocylindria bacterium]|nr:hypothetical protein [Candidatus Limnocylindria bacterium]